MIHLSNIHPLTDFKRDTTTFRERLKKTGQPEVLTVDGRAEIVVQDAEAYQKLLDALERAEALVGIAEGLESARRGEGRDVDDVLAEMRSKLGIRKKRRA